MPELTDEAKAAIADAVRIVHEDRQAKWLKTQIESMRTPATQPPSNTPPAPPVKATPAKTTPPTAPTPPVPDQLPEGMRKSAYWGVFKDENS